MSYIPLNHIIDALSDMDKDQRQLLLNLLQEYEMPFQPASANKLTSLEAIREARFHEGLNCPNCAAHGSFKKNGTYRGRQRYLCKSCKRTFNDLTNTPVHGTHYMDKWGAYLLAMEQGLSLRKCAKQVGISLPTSFAWRHKILHALSVLKNQSLEGIVETDETYVLHSEKGKRNLPRKPRKRGGSAKKRDIP